MKKYVKPDLYFESFQLSQNIASCGWDMNNTELGTCVTYGDTDKKYPDNNSYGVPLFIDVGKDGSNCKAVLDNFCYTNASENEQHNLFISG